MKVNIKKWGTLAFLILGFQWVTATNINDCLNDCYIDIFQKELTDLQSEETIKYFEANYENGYDAWEVLYRADPLEDRMNLSYIDELSTYLTSTGRTVDELVNEVTMAGSYNTWVASVIPKKILSTKDTSKKLDVLNRHLIARSCDNCLPLAEIDIINDAILISNITQWLPSNLTTAKKIGDLEQIKYSDDGVAKVEDLAIYEDPNNLGKLYLSNGREQILEKLFLNEDFKKIYNDMVNFVSQPRMFPDELTLSEEAVYRFYTNTTYYKFNQALINEVKVDGIPETENLLNTCLDKSPSYPGVFYRGIGKEELDLFLKMNIGESITYKNFISTSKEEKLAWIFLKNNKLKTGQGAIVKVISKNGRDISKYSDAIEHEVLHKSNSVFVLEEIKYIDEETIYTGEVIKYFYKIVIKEEGIDAVSIKSGISDTTIPREIEYEFEKLGFYYKLEPSSNGDGTTKILHYLKKEGEEYKLFGNSNITADGIMDENTVIIPKVIEGLGVLDAVYKKLLAGDNGIKKIESEYVNETDFADEYNAFMSVYSTDKNNLTEAALATSEGKILGSDWQPTDIKFNDYGITLTWIKKSDLTTDIPTTPYKKLSEDIEYKYGDPNGEFLNTSLQEIHESIQQLIKESELPEFVKIELAKAEDYHSLKKIIEGHSETFFNIVTSSNAELAEYAMFLVKGLKEELFDYKTYQYLISESEKVFKLTTVTGTPKANRSGYNGVLFNGELNGKKTIFKYDIGNTENAINKMEEILINLRPYGGPEFYGRYKIQIEDGTWREVVAMESIDGVDIKTITESNLDDVTSFKVTETHLKGIDNIEDQFRTDGNILINDVNFGDFILTNDPDRPVVLIDMSLIPGTALHQGLITTSGAKKPVRETIEELIEIQKKAVIPTTNPIKYRFEEKGYAYESRKSDDPDEPGATTIEYCLQKEEGAKFIPFGHSILTKDGVLKDHNLTVPEAIRGHEVSKAVYNDILKEDIKIIESEYPNELDFSDNYDAFMNVYNADKNNVTEAVFATPEGKILESDWEPTNIKINDTEITLTWVKKNNNTTDE